MFRSRRTYLELGPGGLGIAESVDDLAFGARQLGGTLKVSKSIGDLALLEQELGHCCDGNITLGVNWKARH